MYTNEIDYSLVTLNVMSTSALYEIKSSDKYSKKTRDLAARVINARQC